MDQNLIGQKYGMLTVMEKLDPFIDKGGRKRQKYRCVCDCGNTHDVEIHHLLSGKIKSCGCLRNNPNPRNNSHPFVGTRIYQIWGNMVNRCTNPNNPAYKDYGGRGIAVCNEWRDFKEFHRWAVENGYSDSLQIDRIDNDRGYYPDNCRWADRVTQANNKRTNVIVEIEGKKDTLKNIARKYGIDYKVLHRRISLGWTLDRAIHQPVRKSNRPNINAN